MQPPMPPETPDTSPNGPEHQPAGRRRRAWWTYVLKGVGGLVGLVVVLVLALLLILQTEWGAERTKNILLGRLNALFDGAELQVNRLGGNFVGHIALYDVNLVKADGERMAHVDTLTARYHLLPLLRNRLHLTDIYLASPYVRMEQNADSTWDLLNVIAQDSVAVDTAEAQSTLVIELDHFDLRRGTVEAAFYAGDRDSVIVARNLTIELGDMRLGEDLVLRLDTLFTRITPPYEAEGPIELALGGALDGQRFTLGGLRLESPLSHVTGRGLLAWPSEENDQGRDLDFTLTARPLAFADLRLFAPMLDPAGRVDAELRVKGAPERITAEAQAAFSDGATFTLTGSVTPPGRRPAHYEATGRLRGLDPAFFTGNPAQAAQINADLDVDLQGPAPEQFDGRASLIVFDTRYGDYAPDRTTFESTFTEGLARFDLRTGLRGASLTAGGTARPFDDVPSYDLSGRLANLDVGRFSRDGTQQSDVSAAFTLAGRGVDPQTADITARVDLASSRINAYTLREGRLTARLQGGDLDYNARIVLPEGLIAAEGDAAFGDEVRYRVTNGRIRNLDVAALGGDTTRSAVNADFSLTGRGTDPQAMVLQARVDVERSFFGAYRLERANLHADLRGGRLGLTAGADLGAAGTLALSGAAYPFQDVPAFQIAQARFRHLDVGALMQDTTQQSDLNGTLALRGRGSDPATMTLDARLDLDASQLNAQPIESARLDAGLARGTLAFDARLDLPAGSTTLAGSARPFDDVPTYAVREGTFTGLDVGALTGNPSVRTNLNGTLALEGRGLEPATMTLDARLAFDPSTLNEAMLHDGEVTARLDGGAALLEATLALDEGQVRLDAAGRFDTETPTYEAHGRIRDLDLARLTGVDTPDTRFSLGFDVEGAGTDPQTMTLAGNVYAHEGAFGTVRLDTLGTAWRLERGLLRVDSLLLRSNVADAEAGGQIALFDTTGAVTSDFRFRADVVSLEPVRPFIQADVFSLRQGHVEATVQGPSDALRVQASAELNSLVYNTLRLAGLAASFDGTLGPDRRPTRGEGRVDFNYLATPTLTARLTTLQAEYDGDEAAFSAETSLDDRRDAALAGRVDLRPESQRVLLENLGLRLDEDRWTLTGPATIAYGEAYRVEGFTLSSGSQQIIVDGVIDPQGMQDFHVTIENLRTGGFADLLGFQNLGGILEARLDLTGPAAAPLLDGRLTYDVRYQEEPVGNLRLDLGYADARMNLDARLTHREGSTLSLAGFVPMSLSLAPAEPVAPDAAGVAVASNEVNGSVDLRLTSGGFRLDWLRPFLDPETVSTLDGRLTTDVRITGAMDAPVLAGTVRLDSTRARLPQLGLTYEDIEAHLTLRDDNVIVERAVVHAGDGTLTAEGRIAMPELTLGRFEIDLRLDDFRAIRTDAYRATVSGALALNGTTDAPAVSGSLQVYDTDVYITQTAGGDIRQVELTEEDVRMLEEFFGYRVTSADTTTSDLYDALTLDLTVELERDTWVRQTANPELAIEMTGTVELQKQPGAELMLFRSIEVIPQRSFIRQFGRRFDLTEGEVTFNGPIAELMMNVKARHEIPSREHPGEPEAVITLGLSGRLDDLSLTLGSEPQMENADIVSYIATGRPASQALSFGGSGEGGGLLTQGGDLAANQLAGLVEGLAAAELGLDVVEIQQDGLRGMQLVAGKYLSPRLYVGINQPIALTGSSEQSAGTNPTEVTLEYEFFEWLLLQALSGTSTSSVQLNLTGRYAFR